MLVFKLKKNSKPKKNKNKEKKSKVRLFSMYEYEEIMIYYISVLNSYVEASSTVITADFIRVYGINCWNRAIDNDLVSVSFVRAY